MFSQKDKIILKISKINTLISDIVKFDDSLFKSNYLSGKDIKEDLLELGEDFKKQLVELINDNKDLYDLDKQIDQCILEIEKSLSDLKQGKPYICPIFIQ